MTHDDQVTCDICGNQSDCDDTNTTEEGHLFCADCGETRIRWIHDDTQGESYAYLY